MPIRFSLPVGFLPVIVFLLGCSEKPVPGLNQPEKLMLYSIDGTEPRPEDEDPAGEKFQGYPILGQLEISDDALKTRIIEAIRKGLADSDGSLAGCFWPRHAIRSVTGGRTTDYVICFECQQLEVYEDGSSRTVLPITRHPQKVFNELLNSANIPLAPGMIE